MRINKAFKKEMAYNGMLGLIVICTVWIMMIQGLNSSNMTLKDYRDAGENNSSIVFSENN